jgi:regulatory protein YycI of two-component signal transduction system YycFG
MIYLLSLIFIVNVAILLAIIFIGLYLKKTLGNKSILAIEDEAEKELEKIEIHLN